MIRRESLDTTAELGGASGEVFSPAAHLICAALPLPFPANFLSLQI